MRGNEDGVPSAIKTIPLTESPVHSGTYVATIPPLWPWHGSVEGWSEIVCMPETAVLPNGGTSAGGEEVGLYGEHFTGATGVTFGGVRAESFKVLSDEEIVAITPPGSGLVDVVVKTPGGETPTNGMCQIPLHGCHGDRQDHRGARRRGHDQRRRVHGRRIRLLRRIPDDGDRSRGRPHDRGHRAARDGQRPRRAGRRQPAHHGDEPWSHVHLRRSGPAWGVLAPPVARRSRLRPRRPRGEPPAAPTEASLQAGTRCARR